MKLATLRKFSLVLFYYNCATTGLMLGLAAIPGQLPRWMYAGLAVACGLAAIYSLRSYDRFLQKEVDQKLKLLEKHLFNT